MRGALFVLLVCASTAPRLAHGEPLDEAKAAFGAGKQAFERGDYETALREFQRANLLAPAPSRSFNIGKTYEQLGGFHDAALAFDRYLELAGPPQNGEDRQFQENLRARADRDRPQPDISVRTAPAPPPLPAQGAPSPPYFQPYQPYLPSEWHSFSEASA